MMKIELTSLMCIKNFELVIELNCLIKLYSFKLVFAQTVFMQFW